MKGSIFFLIFTFAMIFKYKKVLHYLTLDCEIKENLEISNVIFFVGVR
jgi:hypothetical protein